MSLFSLFKKNIESYSLVFSIGSGKITGAIINFTEEPGVKVIHYESSFIPFQQEVSIPKHLDLMEKTLTELTIKIQSQGIKKIKTKDKNAFAIDRVFYIFSSPWCVSQTKVIKVNESKSFNVTQDYLDKIISDQEKEVETDISKSGKMIEKKIIQMKVNGYVTNNVYGKLTKNLEIAVLFTFVPHKILNIIEKAVTKTFNIKNVWCHSLILAYFSNIRNLFPHKQDFIQIDVSEEMTDISIIKDNIINNTISIPFGRNHFLRDVTSNLKVSPELANSMINMYCLNSNNELANIKFSLSMDKIGKVWLDKISKVINNFKEKVYVIDSVFLIANNDISCFLKNKLQKQDYNVILVENKKVKTQISTEDIAFKLELMFLDKLYKI